MSHSVTQLPAWKALSAHVVQMKGLHLRELFAQDPGRGERLALEAAGLYLDFSKHRVTDETLRLLVNLAEESGLRQRIEAMFGGDPINRTEGRPALHVALRAPRDEVIQAGGVNVVPAVHQVLDRMARFAGQVRAGHWHGFTGKPMRNVVNIGIGGSNLGPAMAYEALKPFCRRDMAFRFVSNVDGASFFEATWDLQPDETLFVISSKAFNTLETMANAGAARSWVLEAFDGNEAAIRQHFVAVSSNRDRAVGFGIDPENVFEFWDWVGGRYSMESAIGLPTMIAAGPDHFGSMLSGFHAIDRHFRQTPFEENVPVRMGLLTVWYACFFGAETTAVLPYSHYLRRFPAYLQQLTMESNGKSVTLDGAPVDYPTGPVFWGEAGTNGQHSFYQLLHQGTRLVPCDFIVFRRPSGSQMHPAGRPDAAPGLDLAERQGMLAANAFAQAEALAFGKTAGEVRAGGAPEWLVPHRTFPGNRPSTTILADRLDPETLGKLVALYEHSVFTQSVIWDINPFDQWGVELGKVLAGRILPELQASAEPSPQHDCSTKTLIARYKGRLTG